MYKIAIVGSRSFNDYQEFVAKLHYPVPEEVLQKCTHIISGGAKGVDSLAALYALSNKKELITHLPDWTIGKHAGFIRNATIINEADYVIAFWDGKSKGTEHGISLARKANKPLIVISTLIHITNNKQ